MLELRFAFLGEVQYARRLDAFMGDLGNLSEPLGLVADLFSTSAQRQFDSEGSSSGRPWQPLNPVYAAWKAHAFPGKGILRATDRLMESFQTGGSEHVRRITPGRLEWGSDVDYGALHQTGGSRLPQRRIVDLTGATRRDIDRVFATWIRTRQLARQL